MKTIRLFAVALALATLSACNDDDGNNGDAMLEGTWQLRRVQGGFGGADEQFPSGVITWTFNTENQTVTVVNNLTPESEYDFFESGTYSYDTAAPAENSICGQVMEIDNLDFGCMTVGSQTLKLDQSITDGFLVTLMR